MKIINLYFKVAYSISSRIILMVFVSAKERTIHRDKYNNNTNYIQNDFRAFFNSIIVKKWELKRSSMIVFKKIMISVDENFSLIYIVNIYDIYKMVTLCKVFSSNFPLLLRSPTIPQSRWDSNPIPTLTRLLNQRRKGN